MSSLPPIIRRANTTRCAYKLQRFGIFIYDYLSTDEATETRGEQIFSRHVLLISVPIPEND